MKGIRLAAERGRPSQVYNISDGIELTLEQYIRIVAETMRRPVKLVRIPSFIARPLAVMAEAWAGWFHVQPLFTRYRVRRATRDCHLSIEKARKELGYEPDRNLAEQVRAQVQWYREHYRKSGRHAVN